MITAAESKQLSFSPTDAPLEVEFHAAALVLPKIPSSGYLPKGKKQTNILEIGGPQLNERQPRVTFTKELESIDDLLESVQESSQHIRKRKSVAPLKPNQLYQRIQVEIPENRELDEAPIVFSQDSFAFAKSITHDSISELRDLSGSDSRMGRTEHEAELPPIDLSLSGSNSRRTTPEPDIPSKHMLRTAHAPQHRPLPILADAGFSSRGTRRDGTPAIPPSHPSRTARTPLLDDGGGVLDAEREILRLMMLGCAREAARACQAALEQYGEIPSLVSTFRRLLQLLRSPPTSIPVKVSEAEDGLLGSLTKEIRAFAPMKLVWSDRH